MEGIFSLLCSTLVSALIALLGKNRKIGYAWSFLLCFFLSPLIGIIIILCSKKKDVEFVNVEKDINNQ